MREDPKTDKSGADTSEETTRRLGIKDIPWLILPTLVWLMFSILPIGALGCCLPIWLAVPLGLVIGFVISVITITIFGDGASTPLELNVGSAILLVLGMILWGICFSLG